MLIYIREGKGTTAILKGSWNNWTEELTMRKSDKYYIINIIFIILYILIRGFSLEKFLPFGLYEFKFIIDGFYYETQFISENQIRNSLGTFNILLHNFPSPM